MGLFRRLGREVEEFKQRAEEAADEEADYRCRDCDAAVYGEHDQCPECGGDLVPVEE